MKFRFFATIAMTVLALTGMERQAHAAIQWESSYDSAVAKSRQTGKPLFIDFYTDWCGWCKKLDADVYPDARIQQLASNFVMLKLNAEKEGAAQAKFYAVTGFPTLIFASSQGQPLDKIPGYMEAKDFAKVMTRALQRSTSLQSQPIAPPVPTVTTRGTMPAMKITDYAPGASSTLKKQLQIQSATTNNGNSGVFLLDENGMTSLDRPAKKPKVATKTAPSKIKAKRKKVGY